MAGHSRAERDVVCCLCRSRKGKPVLAVVGVLHASLLYSSRTLLVGCQTPGIAIEVWTEPVLADLLGRGTSFSRDAQA